MYVYKFDQLIKYGVFKALIAAHSTLEARALMLKNHKDLCEENDAGDLETMKLELQDYTVSLENAKILMYVCYES